MLRYRFLSLLCCLASLLLSASAVAEDWYTKKTQWKGFDQFHFQVAERNAYLVVPKHPAPGKPWIWRARFPGYHAEMDERLVQLGFHLGYVDVAGLFGGPKAMKIGDEFYRVMTEERKLNKRPALEGVSRGGLFVYNWAARNPKHVALIYCDTPVLDFKSWPGGKASGLGSSGAWQQCLTAYGLSEKDALRYEGNPVDRAKAIADAKIPILHIVAENDRVVPPKENTYLLRDRIQSHGGRLSVISVAEGTAKSNGHHFAHPAVDKVVAFFQEHAAR